MGKKELLNTINIFGERVKGYESSVNDYENIVIVEDEKGIKHVVHNLDLGRKVKKTKTAEMRNVGNFDLLESQRIGRTGIKALRNRKRRWN